MLPLSAPVSAIAWSDKFKFENVESADRIQSPILHIIRNSNVLGLLHRRTFEPISEGMYRFIAQRHEPAVSQVRVLGPLDELELVWSKYSHAVMGHGFL